MFNLLVFGKLGGTAKTSLACFPITNMWFHSEMRLLVLGQRMLVTANLFACITGKIMQYLKITTNFSRFFCAFEKTFLCKPLKFGSGRLLTSIRGLSYFMHISICSAHTKAHSRFFKHPLALWVLCRYAFLPRHFHSSSTPTNWSKCQMYNNIENWIYFVSAILIYLGKSSSMISLFPKNFGRPNVSIFRCRASQDTLLAKSLPRIAAVTRRSGRTC